MWQLSAIRVLNSSNFSHISWIRHNLTLPNSSQKTLKRTHQDTIIVILGLNCRYQIVGSSSTALATQEALREKCVSIFDYLPNWIVRSPQPARTTLLESAHKYLNYFYCKPTFLSEYNVLCQQRPYLSARSAAHLVNIIRALKITLSKIWRQFKVRGRTASVRACECSLKNGTTICVITYEL